MLEKLQIGVAAAKGVCSVPKVFNLAMFMVHLGTPIPSTAPKNIYEELRKDFEENNIGMIILILGGGAIACVCVGYAKWLQLKPYIEQNNEETPLLSPSQNQTWRTTLGNFLHKIAGAVAIPIDALLNYIAVDAFLYPILKSTPSAYYTVSVLVHAPGVIGISNQGFRVFSRKVDNHDPMGLALENIKATWPGMILEGYTTAYREGGAKNALYQLTQSNPYLKYWLPVVFLFPFSFGSRLANNFTHDPKLYKPKTRAQEQFTKYAAVPVSGSYGFGDAPLYIWAVAFMLEASPEIQLTLLILLSLAESATYHPNAKKAINLLRHYCFGFFKPAKAELENSGNLNDNIVQCPDDLRETLDEKSSSPSPINSDGPGY